MISSVLVVCVGNVCRSPVGERLLAAACPDLRFGSAGIGALTGHGPDESSTEIAAENGISLEGHIARQFTSAIAADYDLILALELGHMKVIAQQAPEVAGKAMLLGHWLGNKEIADPYCKSREFHLAVFEQLREATESWVEKLGCKQ